MGRITVDQSQQVMATLMTNAEWTEIDFELSRLQDNVIRNPKEAGRQFTAFVKNCCRVMVSKPTRPWREQDGVIYFSATSDGTTGKDWIARLEQKGFRVEDYAKNVLCSPDFKPPEGVTTEIAILKGMLFQDNDRITKNIRAEADRRMLAKPNAEVACLIREIFTDEEIKAMGLWYIVTMHEPIKDSYGDPNLLNANRDDGGRWLGTSCDETDSRWRRDDGFAFVVSQVGPQD